MISKKNLWVAVTIAALFSSSLMAKKFANTYVEFDLPEKWMCRPEGGQYICQPINRSQQKEAIIVMAAKYKGPEDEMDKYKARLSEKREVKDIKGTKYTSSSRYAPKYDPILGTIWIDSLQESSEVPGFITRYLATVQKGLGMVLTFSAHKSKINEYNLDFLQMVNSLRVRDNIPAAEPEAKTDLTKLGGNIVVGNVATGGNKGGVGKPGEHTGVDIVVQKKDSTLMYIVIVVVVILAIYIVMRKRKKNGRR